MIINFDKSVLIPYGIPQEQLAPIHALFPGQLGNFENGFKYLGYYIKANNYHTSDWHWMLRRVDHRIRSWCNRFLSIGGRLTLLSSVLSGIPVYWFTLAQLPVAISEALRKMMVNFLWGQGSLTKKFHLVSWQQIFLPRKMGGWGIRQPFWFNVALCVKSTWRALMGKGLWHDIINTKYMKNLPLELWIRYKSFNHRGGSIFWRSTCRHFHWIQNGLAWLIGDGKSLRIGLDPYAGATEGSYRLPDHMVIFLQRRGFGRLANIRHPSGELLHYWLDSRDLGFTGLDGVLWDRYIGILSRLGIRLNTNPDYMIWDFSPDGDISARSLYEHMIAELPLQETQWWQHRLWTWNISPKLKCFWWLVLRKSILTWDNLVRRGFIGPGICVLCAENHEDIDHIFVFCRFTRDIWLRLQQVHLFAQDWKEYTLGENFRNWAMLHPRRVHLPILVCWTLWRVRNIIIFEQTRHTASTILNWIHLLYSYYPETGHKKKRLPQHNPTQEIDNHNWGTFDGAE